MTQLFSQRCRAGASSRAFLSSRTLKHARYVQANDVAVVVSLLLVAAALAGCGGGSATLTELQRVRSGTIDVVVLSPHGALRHGKDDFVIEFKSAEGSPVDVGEVRAGASMSMSGVPMLGSVTVQRTDVPGRYRADGDFGMAGTWRLNVEWDGPKGKGSVAFSGSVQ